jgi:NAD-dependent dihydropyrimidine dehydrogenase PreA subunit
MNDVYRKLATHLDNLPGSFPATESGVELRILKRLFTPEEAEIAASLNMILETAEAIAARLDMDANEMERVLAEMSQKGLILRTSKGGRNLYMAAQFVIGIWEYHVNDLDEELIRDFNEYVPHVVDSQLKLKNQQLRVIPVSQSLSADMHVMPYEQAEVIIRNQSKILVAPCICRKEHKIVGKGCDKLEEACLIFGGGAYFYEGNRIGRTISQDEALEILKKGLDAGLVLQPSNSKKPINICMCCGCCCQILKNLNSLDKPAEFVRSNFYAEIDADACTACGNCEERCQMNAIGIEDFAKVNPDRCIGCGLCIPACDFEAIQLYQKDEAKQWDPPANTVETYVNIAKERGKIK